MDLDLRHMRYFLATAELGQVTRAAEHLGISQPSLTQALHLLERQIGVELFRRHHTGVELTAAGQELLPRAIQLLRMADEAIDTARAGRRTEGLLRIGVHGAAWGQVQLIIDAFARARPDLTIQQHTLSLMTQEYALKRGQVDAVFNVGVPLDGPYRVHHLRQEPRLLAVPVGHRLADRKQIVLADVLDEPFVSLHPAIPRWCQQLFTLAAERDGPSRTAFAEAGSSEEVLAIVGGHGHLFSAPAETARMSRSPSISWREIGGLAPVALQLVTSRNPCGNVAALAATAVKMAALRSA